MGTSNCPTSKGQVYQLQKGNRTALQSGSMTTSVIQTLQLQRQSQSNLNSSGGASQTYVIKMNPNRLAEHSSSSSSGSVGGGNHSNVHNLHHSNHEQHSLRCHKGASSRCSQEPYAQCTQCYKLVKLDQFSRSHNSEFRCIHCTSTAAS